MKSRTKPVKLAVVSLALSTVLGAQAANASFPGKSGKIAFASNRSGNYDIYKTTKHGSHVVRLTRHSPKSDSNPAWSASGKRIAFQRGSGRDAEIYKMTAGGHKVKRLTHNRSRDSDPHWSPGGGKIVFWSDRRGTADIFKMSRSGTKVRRLTGSRAKDRRPVWSPLGNRILFSSTRGAGDSELYTMKRNGSHKKRLTDNNVRDFQADFSPSGKRIVFARQTQGPSTAEIFRMRTDGSGTPRRLTENGRPDFNPVFSPNGKRIIVQRKRHGNMDIYALKSSDGSKVRRLTNSSKRDIQPNQQAR